MTPSAVTADICTITPPPPPTLCSTGGRAAGRRGISWGPSEEESSATASRQLPVSSAERDAELERRDSISCRACGRPEFEERWFCPVIYMYIHVQNLHTYTYIILYIVSCTCTCVSLCTRISNECGFLRDYMVMTI